MLLLHVLLVFALLTGSRFSIERVREPLSIVTTFFFDLAPPVGAAVPVAVATPLNVDSIAVAEPDVLIELEDVSLSLADMPGPGNAENAAPVLDSSLAIDARPFAVQAGLVGGDEATIVLMVEVLADGQPGAIAVERSGGTAEIDAAAIDYARSLRWVPGRVGGIATSMKVRFGVHLQS
ncbi:MAG TPA: hypothetical protein PK159_14885 [Steroidobacteraceae bacterium]|nr:hypothetical protein [Steroidobacteraceae bacterium]